MPEKNVVETPEPAAPAPVAAAPSGAQAVPAFKRPPFGKGPRRPFPAARRKVCRFCADGVLEVDFKQVQILKNHLMESGRILAARVTGACAWHQRQLSQAIKRARNLALLPYVVR